MQGAMQGYVVVFNRNFVGTKFASAGTRTQDLQTWIFRHWGSSFLSAFSRFPAQSQVSIAGSHCPLEGHLTAADRQPSPARARADPLIASFEKGRSWPTFSDLANSPPTVPHTYDASSLRILNLISCSGTLINNLRM